MKKVCFLLAMFCICFVFSSANPVSADIDTATFFVSINSAYVYKNASLGSEKIKTLKHKDEIEIEISSGSPTEYLDETCVFYKIVDLGYILAEAVSKKTKTISSIPNFNAKTNSECDVFDLNGDKFEKTSTKLSKGQQLFLYEGYDAKKDYTAVAFVKNNEVVYAYVETKNIKPNGINPTIIIVFSTAAAALGVALAWVFISGKKKKKMS